MRKSPHDSVLVQTVSIIGLCAFLSSCAQTEKSTYKNTTTDGFGETRTVEVKETPDSMVTTETTKTVEPKYTSGSSAVYEQPPAVPAYTEPQYQPRDTATVRAPGVRVHASDDTGEVHVKAPFVRINKNGHGKKLHIDVPFVHINAN